MNKLRRSLTNIVVGGALTAFAAFGMYKTLIAPYSYHDEYQFHGKINNKDVQFLTDWSYPDGHYSTLTVKDTNGLELTYADYEHNDLKVDFISRAQTDNQGMRHSDGGQYLKDFPRAERRAIQKEFNTYLKSILEEKTRSGQ